MGWRKLFALQHFPSDKDLDIDCSHHVFSGGFFVHLVSPPPPLIHLPSPIHAIKLIEFKRGEKRGGGVYEGGGRQKQDTKHNVTSAAKMKMKFAVYSGIEPVCFMETNFALKLSKSVGPILITEFLELFTDLHVTWSGGRGGGRVCYERVTKIYVTLNVLFVLLLLFYLSDTKDSTLFLLCNHRTCWYNELIRTQ